MVFGIFCWLWDWTVTVLASLAFFAIVSYVGTWRRPSSSSSTSTITTTKAPLTNVAQCH